LNAGERKKQKKDTNSTASIDEIGGEGKPRKSGLRGDRSEGVRGRKPNALR